MSQVGIRYLGFVACIVMLFSGFVACGAQMYQVSLTDDTAPRVQGAEGTNDPNSPNYGLHAPNGWTQLPIRFRTGFTLSDDQKKGLTKAMATWEIATGKKLFVYEGVHQNTSGDSFPDLYSSLDDQINGHYLDDHWDKTGKPRAVLATTIWDNDPRDYSKIMTADIRFNNDYYLLGNAFVLEAAENKEVVDMQTLALHELGHLLGLAHMNGGKDPQSIMLAQLYIGEGLSNRRLSMGDIERVQRIYGCEGTACDVKATMDKIDKLDLASRGASSESEPQVESDTAH